MQILKADTAVNVKIGSFVDATDGKTPETGITLAAADEAELLKAGTTATADISGNAWGAITNCAGWYWLTLTAAQLDTEGLLTVVVQDVSVCLPVFAHFMVVNANVFDSLYAAATTDYLQVDTVQIEGADATDKINTEADTALTDYDPPTKTEMDAGLAALNDITVAEIIAGIADGSLDLQEMLRLIYAACAGKSAGGGTATLTFRDSADSKNRITATVDADGNRTAVTVDGA